MTGSLGYTRFRAPTENGEKLAVPRWPEWPNLVEHNRTAIRNAEPLLLGHRHAELAAETRLQVVQAAHQYSSQYLDTVPSANSAAPLIVTGHQPELYHPGVWLKNAAAAHFAQQLGGTAINVVIDSDLARSPSIRVPYIDRGVAAYTPVAFDAAEEPVPHEERRVADPELLGSFAQRVAEAGSSVLDRPLVRDWWPTVVERCEATGLLSRGLADARHRLESEWSIPLLQIPLSALVETPGFRSLVAALLYQHEDVATVYNECLADYRRAHRLRTKAQPMPDLTAEDGWHELPLWTWTSADPMRRAVLARRAGGDIELSNQQQTIAKVPAASADAISEALPDLARAGIKLRTRALMTTAFFRYFVGDLFIHGIGGAKYDQVTDRLCDRLFGFPPPQHATLSGTLRLPVEIDAAAEERAAEAAARLRDVRFHPERLLASAQLSGEARRKAEEVAQAKAQWIATQKTTANAAERHQAIEQANASLQQLLEAERTQIEQSLERARQASRNARVLGSREYSFCLFPEERVRDFLLDF